MNIDTARAREAASVAPTCAERVSLDRLRALLDYDPMTGEFRARTTSGYRGCHKAGRVVGGMSKQSGYVRVSVEGRLYQAHVLAWFYVHGEWPASEIDHINTVRHDNRLANLRPATTLQNAQNRIRASKNSKSGVLGVSWSVAAKKWVAYIKSGSVREYLGCHETKELAAAAYLKAKRRLHRFATGGAA